MLLPTQTAPASAPVLVLELVFERQTQPQLQVLVNPSAAAAVNP